MKAYTLLYIVIFFLGACSDQEKVDRIMVEPQILSDELMTSMPGKLLIFENDIVWLDPFSEEFFVHIIDKITGQEILSCGKRGEGPDEFLTPHLMKYSTNELLISDYNLKKWYRFDLKKMTGHNITHDFAAKVTPGEDIFF